MSDQSTGGDGSVRWSLDADPVDPQTTHDFHSNGNDPGPHHQHGVATDGEIGDWFTVSLEVPQEVGNADTYLAQIKAGDQSPLWGIKRDPNDANRVYLNLRIEKKNPDQVRVSWGNSPWVITPKTPGRCRSLSLW